MLIDWPVGGNDIIYGGLGDDFLHGGAGDDAISGAEALPPFYNERARRPTPTRCASTRRRTCRTGGTPFNPRAGIPGFFLDFDTYWTDPTTGQLLLIDGGPVQVNDGNDRIFGDTGDDWLVGGTYIDWLFGGWGTTCSNADDNHWTNGGLNDTPELEDSWFAEGDFAYGGADLDVLIGNTAMDRLFDWQGDFNDFYVPFAF